LSRVQKSSALFAVSLLAFGGAAFGLLRARPYQPPARQETPPAQTNHLAGEKSPYLLLHAHNPVDWYPWGEEAFEKARREQKLIFLSIGYYTCHWCHVMERESYSNPEIAAVLNKYFVSIKVDREERPDVDRLYIAYVESATGSAGWPLNVLLTPDRKPFFGGTYFPPDQLKSLLQKVAEAWANDRASVTGTASRAAQELVQIVNESPAVPASRDALPPAILDQAVTQISGGYDKSNGGFGPAPKFPRPVTLDFLLRSYARTGQSGPREMTLATLRAMAHGGIHDQLGGGFHRYSTDAEWRVPHFEKMLYDQAQLAIIYTDAWQITHEEYFSAIARDILDFTLREMLQPAGGFASALDADSTLARAKPETAEGAYYLWRASEIESLLGNSDAAMFDFAYGVESGGNVPASQDARHELTGKNVLYERYTAKETAGHFGLTENQARQKLAAALQSLFEARSRRPRPPTDDKIVTAWNGMMISALARASAAFNEPRYLEAANSTEKFVEAHLYDPKLQRLSRSYRAGSAASIGFLDDYTGLIGGLLDLYEAGFDVHFLTWAVTLQQQQDQLFWDLKAGGYFDAPASDPDLLARTRESYDGAEPSPNSVAAMNLLRLSQITDRADWRARAQSTLAAFRARLQADPEAVPALASALDYSLAQKRQILIAGDSAAPDTRALLRLVNDRFLPNKILLLADDASGQKQLASWLPFVAGAHRIHGQATAYICENYVCKLPTADPAVAARLLDAKP